MNQNHLDRERFAGEGVLPGGDFNVPDNLYTAEELSAMEKESAELDACYAAEAAAEQASMDALSQPEAALAFLIQQSMDAGLSEDDPRPASVVEVLEVSVGSTTAVRAIVVCDDGITRGLNAGYSYSYGGAWDPPDGDAWFDVYDDVEAFRAQPRGFK